MKIAVLVQHWKNSKGTGVTRYNLNLVESLKKKDEVEIYTIYMNGIDMENYKIDANKYMYPFKVIPVLKKINPDLIYMDTNWYFLLSGVLFKNFKDIKIVSTIHSHPRKLSFIGKLIMSSLFRYCDCITYVSKGLCDTTKDIWGEIIHVKEEITYAGVKLNSVSVSEKEDFIRTFNIQKDSIILLMQSSPIAKVKCEGTKILFDSMIQLIEKYPNIVLIITGEGPYFEELKTYTLQIRIQDNVIFTGWLNNPFVPLDLCDIYVHISLGEGLPLAILEAMAMKKPIISTSVGGIPEVIIDNYNGILVEPKQNIISSSIDKLLENKNLSNYLSENAYLESKKYTWDNCADQFFNIFRACLSNGNKFKFKQKQ